MFDELTKLRAKIDEIDDEILLALSERLSVCKAIGQTKKKQGKPVRDASRENEVYNRVTEKATKLGLNPAQIEIIYREIVNMCTNVQE